MKKDPRLYLLHIRDALNSIEKYTAEGKKHFLKNELIQDAVIYNLAIIGEAVKNLPKAVRDAHTAIPWKDVIGLRNIVIHDYDSTEISKIWRIVERDLPTLKTKLKKMFRELGGETEDI